MYFISSFWQGNSINVVVFTVGSVEDRRHTDHDIMFGHRTGIEWVWQRLLTVVEVPVTAKEVLRDAFGALAELAVWTDHEAMVRILGCSGVTGFPYVEVYFLHVDVWNETDSPGLTQRKKPILWRLSHFLVIPAVAFLNFFGCWFFRFFHHFREQPGNKFTELPDLRWSHPALWWARIAPLRRGLGGCLQLGEMLGQNIPDHQADLRQ